RRVGNATVGRTHTPTARWQVVQRLAQTQLALATLVGASVRRNTPRTRSFVVQVVDRTRRAEHDVDRAATVRHLTAPEAVAPWRRERLTVLDALLRQHA